ncbi:MAG: monofunctional biosynthetic peptidoglycan transglycosylase [Deltaproteobacteria bacterium]|nr:monofunctional biosynthetic peptidoglycan transglycosylase [Deltaproteobacteria bacterium]
MTAGPVAPQPRAPGHQVKPWRRRLTRWAAALAIAALALPPAQCLLLNWVDPPWTGTMLQRSLQNGWAGAGWSLPAYRWTDLEDLPRSLPTSAMSSEDRSFLHHDGFDWVSIRRAWGRYRNRPGSRLVGGSTISQQVARNVFLVQHRSWLRKGLEAWYTVWLEATVSKRRILEVYLNVAEMGPMVFGAEAAARHWYGKSAKDLSSAQSAALIGLLPSPRRWTPKSPHVQRRATWILRSPVSFPKSLMPDS